ncbi:pyridoxamine 5'-phosphate oxidase family protein [Oscillospiraceae bacterium 21-37]
MEFRKMRRERQELAREACEEILSRNTAGVLGDGGYPYAVPLSYIYQDSALYFHCAKEGHKLEALQNCPKASFCVVDQDEIVPEKYTTYFRSVIAFGQASLLEDAGEVRSALQALGIKYAPMESAQRLESEIEQSGARVGIIKLEIEHMTGKEAIELVKRRNP